MTNQNPAVPHSQSPKLDRDILNKVNAHADRSLDRLFADIEDLLSGDLESERQSPPERATRSERRYAAASARSNQQPSQPQPPAQSQPASPYQSQTYLPQSDFVQPQLSGELDPPQAVTSKPKQQRIPTWIKAFLGIGVTSIAVSSLLLWAINERKIVLPNNIDTSWLPFQSQSRISPEDAKFADYMRKSIAKIESATTQSTSATAPIPTQSTNPTTTPVNPADTTAVPTSQAAPIAANPTGEIVAVQGTVAPTTPIALLRTIQSSDRPGAIFQIDRQNQTVHIGQKIGTSNWSLLTVAKGEVIVKGKGGEIRSIFVGQKF